MNPKRKKMHMVITLATTLEINPQMRLSRFEFRMVLIEVLMRQTTFFFKFIFFQRKIPKQLSGNKILPGLRNLIGEIKSKYKIELKRNVNSLV